jgi:hypothetical protein
LVGERVPVGGRSVPGPAAGGGDCGGAGGRFDLVVLILGTPSQGQPPRWLPGSTTSATSDNLNALETLMRKDEGQRPGFVE